MCLLVDVGVQPISIYLIDSTAVNRQRYANNPVDLLDSRLHFKQEYSWNIRAQSEAQLLCLQLLALRRFNENLRNMPYAYFPGRITVVVLCVLRGAVFYALSRSSVRRRKCTVLFYYWSATRLYRVISMHQKFEIEYLSFQQKKWIYCISVQVVPEKHGTSYRRIWRYAV